jgi:hypothetical protein
MGTLVAEVAELGLVPQQTSEASSEVELAPEAELNVVITFATAFKSFKQSLTPEVKAAAGKLKEAFGVRQGYQGRTMIVEGREMEWKTFVDRYFGITPRRFNQILEIDDETARPKTSRSSGGRRRAALRILLARNGVLPKTVSVCWSRRRLTRTRSASHAAIAMEKSSMTRASSASFIAARSATLHALRSLCIRSRSGIS